MTELVLRGTSTNVRFRAPKAAPLFFRAVQALGTETAAAILERFFVSPRRGRLTRQEIAFLRSGRRQTIDSGESRIATWSWGEGRTVMVVHGWGSTAGRFHTIAAALVAAGYRVVAFDAPGHGESSGHRSSLPESARALSAVAAREYESRGAWPHAVIAHSFGSSASIVAQLAGVHRTRNVFIAPSTDFDSHMERMRSAMSIDPRVLQRMIEKLEQRLGFSWASLSTPHRASAIETPALIIHDPADAEVPYADAQLLQRTMPRATLVPVSGLGHRRVLHDADVVQRVVAFVGS